MTAATSASRRFPLRVGRRSRLVIRLWGARPETAYADLGDDELLLRFGRFRLGTALANVVSYRIEGPFIWIKAIGVRMNVFGGGDISFAGAAHGGVRVELRERIAWGPLRVPAIYVGADDLEGFAAALRERGIEGVDARKGNR